MKPYAWIVNPWFDVLFIFGGALWIFFAIHYLTFGWNNPEPDELVGPALAVNTSLMILGVLGQHFFADAHTVATYMRIYATPESRKTFKLYAYYLPFCSLALLTMSFIWKEVAGLVIYIHMMWVFQHYVGQCYGVGLIYCYKRNYIMTKFEREVFRWFMHSLSYVIIARILTQREYSPYAYWGVEVPFWGLPMWMYEIGKWGFITMSVLFVFTILRKYHRDGQFLPMGTIGNIVAVLAIGWSTGMASSIIWVYGPPFFHGTQYLAVSLGFYIKEKGLEEGMLPKEVFSHWFRSRALKYWAIVVMAGMFIYIVIPHFMVYFGLTFALVGSCIQACVNFHHFVSDAAIWRLRDQRCREILVA